MKFFLSLAIWIPFVTYAQETGIRFEHGSSWKEEKVKAKKEKKYIFLDCYATWCGPCKLMEKEVFPNNQLGNYFNANFISLKLQMDKTDKDNDQAKNWYADADTIQKEYGIPGYPTFLFFSPDGKLVARNLGFKNADDLISIAKKIITHNADKSYQRYYALIDKYKKGVKDFTVIPYLLDTARLLGQNELADSLTRDYLEYLQSVKDEDVYTRNNIAFIATIIKGSKSKFFHLFYAESEKTDSIMGQRGFASQVLDGIIEQEDIYPIVQWNTGMQVFGSKVIAKQEPEWAKLVKDINSKYRRINADSLVLIARIRWYNDQLDLGNCAKWFTALVKSYPMIGKNKTVHTLINGICWGVIFKMSVDNEQIDAAIECLKTVLDYRAEIGALSANIMDTYANLLYKADKINEAIEWEEKAWKESINSRESESARKMYLEVINKMKSGEPTWPHYIGRGDAF